MESFFGTVKIELVHHREYPDRDTARRDLFFYVEGYYSRRRVHSANRPTAGRGEIRVSRCPLFRGKVTPPGASKSVFCTTRATR
jgi:transposase InsO family protein